MWKKGAAWFEKWGYALLCVLCAAVVLLSALWTRSADEGRTLAQNAAGSMDEHLSDVQPGNTPQYARPVSGLILRPFSRQGIYFDETGVYRVHTGVDFAAEKGGCVYAAQDGEIILARPGQIILQCGSDQWLYLGVNPENCSAGDRVKAGRQIGTASGHVPLEGDGHVCLTLLQDGQAADFAPRLP